MFSDNLCWWRAQWTSWWRCLSLRSLRLNLRAWCLKKDSQKLMSTPPFSTTSLRGTLRPWSNVRKSFALWLLVQTSMQLISLFVVMNSFYGPPQTVRVVFSLQFLSLAFVPYYWLPPPPSQDMLSHLHSVLLPTTGAGVSFHSQFLRPQWSACVLENLSIFNWTVFSS